MALHVTKYCTRQSIQSMDLLNSIGIETFDSILIDAISRGSQMVHENVNIYAWHDLGT